MIRAIINKIQEYRKNSYLTNLVKNGLTLGKNVQIEGDFFFDPSHCFLITIEDDCALAPGVRFIAHDGSLFQNIGVTRIGKITLKKNTVLGDSVIVLPGVTIGPNCIVGAGSVVTKTIPPNSVAVGNPAKVLCTLEELLDKHKKQSKMYRNFHEKEYNIKVITSEKRKEMLEYLEGNVGYMVGDTEDKFIAPK
jgi:maltose O-acetyltransferase